jgi:hypothetical protein
MLVIFSWDAPPLASISRSDQDLLLGWSAFDIQLGLHPDTARLHLFHLALSIPVWRTIRRCANRCAIVKPAEGDSYLHVRQTITSWFGSSLRAVVGTVV